MDMQNENMKMRHDAEISIKKMKGVMEELQREFESIKLVKIQTKSMLE